MGEMFTWPTLCLPLRVLTALLLLRCAVCQNVISDGTCGESKGCFSDPAGCDPSVPATDTNGCTAFSSWSYNRAEDKLEIGLRSETSTYIAIGFSKSGGMADSDVYACTSGSQVRRSRNPGSRQNIPAELIGVSAEDVSFDNGVISCSFMREINRPAGENDGGNFFDLGNAEYTAILAWGGPLSDGNIGGQHVDRSLSSAPINFLENSSAEVGSTSYVLAKLHGCLMVLAWFGFAGIGITTARFFKKALPGEICGKPSWFAVHRFCMAFVFTLTVIAYIVIIIHAKRYLNAADGKIRFTHTIIGTIVVALALLNFIMALVRPHPGQPRRNLFNWAHWGVGVTAHLLAGITVMLGTSNRESQAPDVLLSIVPTFVFWLVISLTFFHLFVWLVLTLIDILKKKESPNVTVHHHAGTDNTHASTNALTSEEPQKEPVAKLVVYGVYFAVVATVVAAIVLGVAIGKQEE